MSWCLPVGASCISNVRSGSSTSNLYPCPRLPALGFVGACRPSTNKATISPLSIMHLSHSFQSPYPKVFDPRLIESVPFHVLVVVS